MSKLEELIWKFCPNGAEYAPLESVCQISKGVQINKSAMNDIGTYPVINGGIAASGYIEQYNQEENTITISQGGASAGYMNWIETKFWAGAHCYVLKPTGRVLNRYLFHFVKSKEHKLQECQYGAGIPALAKSTVASLQIPLPPLPVQQEIVRILDSFTELTAGLTAELTARRKQYEHYRDELLTFRDDSDIEFLTMGDIYDFQYGKGNKIPTGTGEYPVYGSNGIVGSYDEYNSEDAPVIGHIGAYAGIVNWGAGKHFVTYNGVICKLTNSKVLKKYGYYLLLLQNYITKAKDGSQPFVSYDILKQPLVPIPSLEKQAHIVSILDRFDAICNDLTSGLPAEIAARQKQYEYYRDKLLTFKELETD